jgi:hypothetical protein
VFGCVFWRVEAELLFAGSNFLYLGEFPCSWDVYPCCGSVLSISGCVLSIVGVIGTIRSTFSLAGRSPNIAESITFQIVAVWLSVAFSCELCWLVLSVAACCSFCWPCILFTRAACTLVLRGMTRVKLLVDLHRRLLIA